MIQMKNLGTDVIDFLNEIKADIIAIKDKVGMKLDADDTEKIDVKKGKGKKIIAFICAGLMICSLGYAGILDRGVEENAAIDTTKINLLSGDPQNTDIAYSPGYNKGIQLPKVATASLLAAASYEGVIVYDDTLNAAYVSDGATWNSVAGSTVWNAIGDPAANGSITFGTWTNIFTGAAVAADQHTIINTGNMGDVSILVVQQTAGNPTDGTVFEVKAADENIDGIVVTNTTADLTADNTLFTGGFTDDGDANGYFIKFLDNALADTKFSVGADGAVICGTIGSASIISTGSITGNALVGTTGSFSNTVTLDDGVGASPNLILTDATDESATFTKQDGADLTMTILAADSLRVVTGNLRVGNGVAATAPMDGEDLYCEGNSEFASPMQLNGLLTGTLGATISGAAINLNNDSNFAVNIGTGTCTSTVTVGNTANMVNVVSKLTAAGQALIIDADTTAHTNTAGCIDLGMTSLTDNAGAANIKITSTHAGVTTQVGLAVDIDDDATAGAGFIEGIQINASDVTPVGGTTTIRGIMLENTLSEGINALCGAAMKALVINATTTLSTSTTGVIDMDFRSLTTASQAINLDVESDVAGGAGEEVCGIKIQLDDDSNTATDVVIGIDIGSDGDAVGLQWAILVADAGIDLALKAENGSVDVDAGIITASTTADEGNAFDRNFNGAGTAAVLTVTDTDTDSTNAGLSVVQHGIAASEGITIAHDGDGYALGITAGAARTGDCINITTANQLAETIIAITGASTGTVDRGLIDVYSSGVLAGSLVRLDSDTGQPTAIDGYNLYVDDDSIAAAAVQFAVRIDAATNEALIVTAGRTQLIDTLELGGDSGLTTPIAFEGATADGIEIGLTVEDPTAADRTITLPDYTGAIPLVIYNATAVVDCTGVGATTDFGSLAIADDWFKAGKCLKWTVYGRTDGTGGQAMALQIYIADAAYAAVNFEAAQSDEFIATFILDEHTNFANQDIVGQLLAATYAPQVNVATDTTDFAGGAVTVKLQGTTNHAGDHIYIDHIVIEHYFIAS